MEHPTNNLSEENQPTNVYIGSGLSCLHGAAYQLKLLMLFLMRAIGEGCSFYLATEIEAAEKFDDVVFQFVESGRKVHIFVQTKHKLDERRRIIVDNFLYKIDNDDYVLAKYFISYLKIKHNSDFTGSVLRDYILCTNINLDLDPSTAEGKIRRIISGPNQVFDMFVMVAEDDNLFFRDGGTRYRFYYQNNEIISKTKPFFLNALEEEIEKLKNMAKKLHGKLEPRQIKKSDSIRQWLSEFEKISCDNVEEEIKAFFDSLVLAVDQPNEIKLTQIMKSELSRKFDIPDSNHFYARFQELMIDWLKDRRGYFITREEGVALFYKLKEEIIGNYFFNVQSPIESFFGREKELKALDDLIKQGQPAVVCQPVSICGLGGIGKTQLVRKYISEFGKHFDNVLWIEAETYESMKTSFAELARVALGVTYQDRDIKFVLKETYGFFAKRNCLFVFDNADTFRSEDCNAGLRDFLPSSVLPSEANSLKVLITSRNRKWGSFPQLLLTSFTEKEALDFIRFELGIEDESQDADIINLTEILQCFPLAIQQAVAYIKEKKKELKNVGSEFKITDYIRRFKEETKKLLDFNFPEDSRDSYTKTTYIIMKISIEKIKQNKKLGEQAGHILDIIALLAPANIPVEMFLELDLIENNRENLGMTIQLLKQYSLITSEQVITLLNVHRLVQQVTRIILKEKESEEKTFNDAITLLIKMFNNTEKMDNYDLMRYLLTHSESFLCHLDSWSDINFESHQIRDSYFLNLSPFLSKGYEDLGYPSRQKKLQEQILAIHELTYGKNNIILTATINNLGIAYAHLGNHQKEKEMLERAIAIQEKHYGSNHSEVANTLLNLSNAYGSLGNPQKQKELLERALKIDELHHGSDHFEVAKTLVNLGIAYGSLGYPQKQKELIERALKIQQIHYGSNHFEVATTLVNLSNAYDSLGYPQKQKELLERALNIQQEHYGSNHYKIASTLVNYSIAYGSLGCYQKQKKLLKRALEIQEKHYGRNNFEVAITLVNLSNAYGSLGYPQKQKELLERALEIQIKHYGSNHLQVTTTLVSLSNAYGSLGYPQNQKELLEQALKIQQEHYGSNHFQIAITLGNLGDTFGSLGYPHKQKELLERALEIEIKHYGSNHFKVAKTLVNLSIAYGSLGCPQKQKELLERALEVQEKHYGKNHLKVANTLLNLSNVFFSLGQPQKQKELLERVLDINEKQYGRNHFEVANTLVHLGVAYGFLGSPQKQKELLEQALKIQQKHYGSNHLKVASTLCNLGIAYESLSNPRKQKELLEQALEIQEKHYGRNHFEVATSLVNLGNAYGSLGNPQKQKELQERAIEIQEKHYGRNHFEVATSLVNLGNAYGSLGNPQKQKELLERALKIQEKHYGRNNFEVARTLVNLGSAYGIVGYPQKAKELLERALEIEEKHYGSNHFEVATTLVNLSIAYGSLGYPQKQKELLERALEIQIKHYGSNHWQVVATLLKLMVL